MGARELCLGLIKADTEEEVISLLKESGYWDDESAWRNYGDVSINFSSVGNQQSQAESALVEKVINSIDAMLLRECRRKGINPEDPDSAPQSIKEARDAFFGINRGALSTLSSSRRAELAKNILLMATGDKDDVLTGKPKAPSITIIDKGEGQTPAKFPDTLVSLNKENKVKIPFVQGKFNMGATGALQFCGTHGLQLIVSRRDPKIASTESDDSSRHEWGFTVVRRFRPRGTMKTSVFRYLAPIWNPESERKEVLSFTAESIPVIPGKYPATYEGPLEWGTLVKLYDYNLGSKTNILFGPFFHLSVLLPETALPVRVYERRRGFRGRGWEKTLTGITVTLEDPKTMEREFPKDAGISVAGQNLPCKIYLFKKPDEKKAKSPYLRTERILFSVNGQTHGWFEKPFFRRKSVKMSSYIRDSVLVDCTSLPREIAEDLFMNSRDRLRYDEHRAEIEQQLAVMLREHKELREIAVRRRQQEFAKKLGDEKPLEEVLRNILDKSPSIARIFKPGPKLSRPFPMKHVAEQQKHDGKMFPTFFELDSEPYREITSNRFFMLYSTDAVDTYFSRDDKPGEFTLRLNGTPAKFTWSLSRGSFRLGIDLPEDAKRGDVLNYESKVTDHFHSYDPDSPDPPWVYPFQIEVGKFRIHPSGGKPTRKSRSGDHGFDKEGPAGITIPKVKEIYEEDWGTEYNRFSALKVEDDGEGNYDFFVNMDNIYLQQDVKDRTIEAEILKAQWKYPLVLVGLAFLQEEEDAPEDREESSLEMIPAITRKVAPMLLPMIHDLGELVEAETE